MESAASMIAMLRYGSGFPWNRLEKLEDSLGIPLPAATQCQIMEETAVPLQPALEELEAAGGARGSGAQRRYFHAGAVRWTGMRTFPRSAPGCSPAGW